MWQSNRAGGQGRAMALLLPLRVLNSPLYILWSQGLSGRKVKPTKKVIFLISKPFWTNLVIKHKVLTNIVTIAFALLGGRRSLPFPTRARVVYRRDVQTIVRGAGSWHPCIDPCT